MKTKWRKATLKDCVVINESTYSPKEAWPFINYLDTGNITDNRISDIQHLVNGIDKIPTRARRKCQPGDIVYSTVRPNQRHYGLIKEIPENFLASTGFAVVRGRSGVADTDFIYWFLAQDHIVTYLHSIAETSTTAYPSIRPADLEQLPLSLPPLAQQRAIAHILALDDKIDLNRRMNETLEEMARALFTSWFVHYDPVHAKIDGRWRRGESLPGLPADLYDLFPSQMTESELGEIPEGWEVRPLGEVASMTRGRSYRRADLSESNVALVTLKSFARGGGYQSDGLKPYSGPYKPEQVVESGDVVVSCTDVTQAAEVIGRSAMVRRSPVYQTLVASLDCLIIRPRSDAVTQEFLYLIGRSEQFAAYTYSHTTGTTVLHLSPNAVLGYLIAMPSAPLVRAFTNLVTPMMRRIELAELERENLAALRDALLPKLVSGEVQVGGCA